MPNTATVALLDALTIDQMAAGEVVERPASVAKELVENAFDAGAHNVEVVLQGGGLSSLSVQDDGSGMLPEDAARSILRHATSKLRCAQDLATLSTMGFRGEALSSISAVSRLTLTTRPHHCQVGYRLVVHGGAVQSARPVGCPVGTHILVEDLFYNVPARRKFMRAKATEQAHVLDVLLKVALASAKGGVVLRAGARRLLDVPYEGSAITRAQLALGQNLGTTVMIDRELEGVAVSGVLAAQPLDRGEGRRVWLFVNGRFVRDRSLQRAALTACGECFGALTPTALIYLSVPPQEVDVNVHPQKLEVRFANGAAVHRAVTAALQEAAAAWGRAQRDKISAAASPALGAARSPVVRPRGAGQNRDSSDGSAAHLNATTVTYAFAGQRAFAGSTGAQWRGARVRPSQPAPFRPLSAPLAHGQSIKQPHESAAPAIEQPLPGMPAPRPSASLWQSLVPLGVAPEGYLCCRRGKDLALVHMRQGEQAVLLQQMLPLGQAIAGAPLMMPPTWLPQGPLQAVADDYLIETAQRPSPWGVTLEPVGPGAFVVVAVPEALSAFAPELLAQQLMAQLHEAKLSCHKAYAERGEHIVRLWLQEVLRPWNGPGAGSAVVWGPSFLRRLHDGAVSERAPYVRLLDGEGVAAIPGTTAP